MTTPTSSLKTSSTSIGVDGVSIDGIPKRGNALSNKLTSVLSSSYADTEIRDALRLYNVRYRENNLDHEDDLKYKAHKEVIEANAAIVDDFAKVAKQLNRVGTLVTTLNQTCDAIRKHVLAAKAETAPMLEEASVLLAQKQETEHKQQMLDRFRKHFLLSDAELTTLTSSAEPVNDEFFSVLARTKVIHKDCELLLGYENQRLGLELMEQTARHLNAGYKKLFSWTQREFKGLDLEDAHISGSIRRSLRALSDRPALFQNCLDSFAEARQNTVSDAFQKALTDSTMGATRAIDFSTHDPLRYIGDMLAWVHSATVSEMEALEGLFISDADEINRGLHSGKTADPFSMAMDGDNDEEAAFDGYAALNSLISRNMSRVSHTLTQRVGITVRNLTDPVDIYKAYNVLSFYHDMFLKLIRHSTTAKLDQEVLADNSVLRTLTDLQSSTFKHFETTALEALHNSIDDQPNADLSSPAALGDTLSRFDTIARTRGPNLAAAEFAKLYGTLVKPVIDSCSTLAENLQSLHGDDEDYTNAAPSIIYRLNYTSLVRDSLSNLTTGPDKIDAASQPLTYATDETDSLRETLTDLLTDKLTSTSGLQDLRNRLSTATAHSSALKQKKHCLKQLNPDTSESTLERLATELDTFLASALMDTQDDLSRLHNREIASTVIRTAVDRFCTVFADTVDRMDRIEEDAEREQLAARMGKGSNGRQEVDGEDEGSGEESEGGDGGEMVGLREIYPRTLEEVRALLS